MSKYQVTVTLVQEFEAADIQAANEFASEYTKEITETGTAKVETFVVAEVKEATQELAGAEAEQPTTEESQASQEPEKASEPSNDEAKTADQAAA